MITITHYLVLSALLFGISAMGIFMNRKNVLILLMSIELMLLAVNFNFIAFSRYLGDSAGQIFVFFVLPVARPNPPSAWRLWFWYTATATRST